MFNPVWEANVKNPEQTLGKFIDRQSTAFIGSLDADGFPNIKAMLAPRQREGLRVFYFTTNASSLRGNTAIIRRLASISATGVFSGA